MDIKQEIMQLRSANSSLQFQVEQKDDLIANLRAQAEKNLKENQDASNL